MKKIYILIKYTLTVLFVLAFSVSGYSADKTNVIVILIDDMGYMDSETYGSEYYKTPNLTRLANEGMLFTNGYAASPLCSPTRASIMSGQHPARIRMTQAITNDDVAEPEATQPNASWNCGNVQNRHHLPLDIIWYFADCIYRPVPHLVVDLLIEEVFEVVNFKQEDASTGDADRSADDSDDEGEVEDYMYKVNR